MLIVGAGLTGLTAAMELSRLGIPVRLIDKRPGPSATPRTLVVHPRTAELLEQRGLSPETLAAGNRVTHAAVYWKGGLLGTAALAPDSDHRGHVLLACQTELERVLREQLVGQDVTVEYGTELVALAQAEPGWRGRPRGPEVTARLRHPGGSLEEVTASYLISADGRQGTTGQLLNLRLPPPLRHGRVFFGADAAYAYSPATGQGANCGIQDMVNLSWKLAMVLQEKAAPALLGTYAEERLQAIDQLEHRAEVLADSRSWPDLRTDLAGEVIPDYWSSPLSAPPRGPGCLQPGGSVPDMRILTRDPGAPAGSPPRAMRLHELINPSRLNLLLADDTGPAETPDGLEQLRPWRELMAVRLVAPVPDVGEQLRFSRAFGSGQSLMLVRPDLHVCFADRPKTLPRLVSWLNTWFPPGPGGLPVRRRQLAGWQHRI